MELVPIIAFLSIVFVQLVSCVPTLCLVCIYLFSVQLNCVQPSRLFVCLYSCLIFPNILVSCALTLFRPTSHFIYLFIGSQLCSYTVSGLLFIYLFVPSLYALFLASCYSFIYFAQSLFSASGLVFPNVCFYLFVLLLVHCPPPLLLASFFFFLLV